MPQPKFPDIEEQILKYWEEHRVFEKSLEKPAPRGDFVFYDGPPFATGLPHYGHILASTIKDVIPRYKTMRGYHVRRRWGWDCHGLPIEHIVEQQLGISGKRQIEERGIGVFNSACRQGVLKYAAEWGKMVRRIGRFVEFENSYKTMDSTYMESVWWALRQMWDKKLIYEGRKVLLYCPRCETPISNFEVAMDNSYDEVDDLSTTVKFKITDERYLKQYPNEQPTYFVAWTTTPWSLFSTMGLAIGPEFTYAVVRFEDAYYILAQARVESVFQGLRNYEIVRTVNGRELDSIKYEHLVDYYYSQVRRNKNVYRTHLTDYVSVEEGTGIVTINPAYGEIDYEAGLRFKLPVILDLSDKGMFEEMVKDFAGREALGSNEAIAEFLKSRGTLLRADMVKHSYPFCWRCDTKLFYRAIPAWFIKISKLKQKLLRLNEKVNWYPEHLKHGRFKNGIEGAPDWNISRNRYWATPLPFWRCVEQPVIASEAKQSHAKGIATSPSAPRNDGRGGCDNVVCIGSFEELKQRAVNFDAVYKSKNLSEIDLHRPYIDGIKLRCEKCQGEMRRIPEVVDCWVESASMPFAELHYPFENEEIFKKRYPADFVAEYIAQTRAWFYVSHVVGSALFGKPPFRNVVTTGTILNEKGEKLSKSKQNYPDPWDIVGRYGVDSLRFYLMTSPVMQADNLFFAEREVDGVYKKVILLTLNVLAFYKLYFQQIPNSQFPIPNKIPNSKNVLDEWIIARLHETIRDMTEAMDKYDVVRTGRLIPDFVDDLSTWYLRRSRERFKSEKKREREAAMGTLGYVLGEFSKLIAPFMPFLSEHIYGEVSGVRDQVSELKPETYNLKPISVHLTEWPKVKKTKIDAALLDEMKVARKIVEMAHAARAQAKIKVRQPLLELKIKNEKLKMSDAVLSIIADEVNVKEIRVVETVQEGGAWQTKTDGALTVALGTEITPELQKEGTLRELTRHINEARKIAGLTPSDTVHVIVATADLKLRAVVKEFQKQLRKSVIAQSVKAVDGPQEVDWSAEVELEGREKLWIGMRRV